MSKWVVALLLATLLALGAAVVGVWALVGSREGTRTPAAEGGSVAEQSSPATLRRTHASGEREPTDLRKACPHPADRCSPGEQLDLTCPERGISCLKGRVHACVVHRTCLRHIPCLVGEAKRCARRVLCPQAVGLPCLPSGIERCRRLRICDALPGGIEPSVLCMPGTERCPEHAGPPSDDPRKTVDALDTS